MAECYGCKADFSPPFPTVIYCRTCSKRLFNTTYPYPPETVPKETHG